MRSGRSASRIVWVKRPVRGQTGRASWLFVEAVLRIVRTAAPWRELPGEFGKWNPVFKRVRRWVKADILHLMLTALSSDADLGSAMSDGTIVKGHPSGQGSKGGLLARPSIAGVILPKLRGCGSRIFSPR